MMLSSHASFEHIKVANAPHKVPNNPKKINHKGVFLRYEGYSIISKIHPNYLPLADQIEDFLKKSSFRKSYSALPADTYHITVYTIPNRRKLNAKELDYRNSRAVCTLERFRDELYIKSASLELIKGTISIRVELQPSNVQMIRNELATVYGNPMPHADTFHMTLAYVFGKMEHIDMNDWNDLNWLVGQFNGAILLPPKVYRFDSMINYTPFSSSCRSQTQPDRATFFRNRGK